MKGRLTISELKEENENLTDIFYSNNSFNVFINTNLEDDFLELIAKPYDFDVVIDTSIEIIDYFEESENAKEFYEDFKKNRIEYLKNVEFISFDVDSLKIAEYIKRNPILKTKKIILKNYNTLESGIINEIQNIFGEDTKYLYFEIEGNQRAISFDEYKNTVEKVDKFINEIKLFDFSPMEQIMYLYDFVRNKVYCREDNNEDHTISRDFTSALLGKKIVCVGYSKIFIYLLEKIGIEGIKVDLERKDGSSGHARVVIYVKDPKYDIDGVYYFDPTWDSKEREGDNEYLFSYRYFALTEDEMDKASKHKYFDDRMTFDIDELIELFEKYYDNNGWNNMPRDIISQINYINYLINKKRLIHILPYMNKNNFFSKEEVIKNIKELKKYFKREINAEIFLKILFNVRKIQYYYDPNVYPFGLEEFFKTLLVSKWNFIKTPEDKILIEIFGEKEEQRNTANKYVIYMDETNLRKYIDEIKGAVNEQIKEEKKQKK